MSVPLRLGIAGLGTVGIGVVKIVQEHADLIAARAGRPVTITAVSARDPKKNRDADLSRFAWEALPTRSARVSPGCCSARVSPAIGRRRSRS